MKKIMSIVIIFSIFLSITFVLANDGVTELNATLIGLPAVISIEVPDSVDFGEVEAGENYFNTVHSKLVELNNTGNTDVLVTLSLEEYYEGIFENLYASETKSNPSNDFHYLDFELEIDAPINATNPGKEHFYIWLDLTNVTAVIGDSNETVDLIYTAVPL